MSYIFGIELSSCAVCSGTRSSNMEVNILELPRNMPGCIWFMYLTLNDESSRADYQIKLWLAFHCFKKVIFCHQAETIDFVWQVSLSNFSSVHFETCWFWHNLFCFVWQLSLFNFSSVHFKTCWFCQCWPGPKRSIVLTEIYSKFAKPSIQILSVKQDLTFSTIQSLLSSDFSSI